MKSNVKILQTAQLKKVAIIIKKQLQSLKESVTIP